MLNLTMFTNILSVCKVLHWATQTFSYHVALDTAYDDFYKAFDKYIEIATEIYGQENIKAGLTNVKLLPDENIKQYLISEFGAFNEALENTTGKWPQLRSIQDEILGIENQLIYKINMR